MATFIGKSRQAFNIRNIMREVHILPKMLALKRSMCMYTYAANAQFGFNIYIGRACYVRTYFFVFMYSTVYISRMITEHTISLGTLILLSH